SAAAWEFPAAAASSNRVTSDITTEFTPGPTVHNYKLNPGLLHQLHEVLIPTVRGKNHRSHRASHLPGTDEPHPKNDRLIKDHARFDSIDRQVTGVDIL